MKVMTRALPVLIAVVLVAALLLGMNNLHSGSRHSGPGSSTASGTTGAAGAVPDSNDLDLAAVSDADVATCLTPDFATAVADVDVLYGEVQSTPSGQAPVLVLRNHAGDVRLCDAFGGDSPAVAPMPTPSDTEPVAFLSTGRASWQCTGPDKLALGGYQATTWLAVAPTVRTLEQRYVVDGTPGEWFSTTARGGYAHLHTWIDGPQPAGTTYAVQWRVLDADGHPVQQSALPTAAKPLPGCTSGGSAEIG
jgi:hypothetical protein